MNQTAQKMKKLLTLISILALAGCVTAPAPAPALQSDIESAQLLSSALNRVEKAPSRTSSADAKATPAKMDGSDLSISFAGDAKDLLRQVASARGKKFKVLGAEPHLPLFVIVDLKNTSLEDFLTDVGAQLGQRADLAITDGTIEVRYRDHK